MPRREPAEGTRQNRLSLWQCHTVGESDQLPTVGQIDWLAVDVVELDITRRSFKAVGVEVWHKGLVVGRICRRATHAYSSQLENNCCAAPLM